jgi:hypothetical protein
MPSKTLSVLITILPSKPASEAVTLAHLLDSKLFNILLKI